MDYSYCSSFRFNGFAVAELIAHTEPQQSRVMASDTVFTNHLTWARNSTFAPASDEAHAQAVSAWDAMSAPAQATFQSQIESMNEARALQIEAMTYLRNQDTAINFNDVAWVSQGQWLPLLNKAPANMSYTEAVQVDSLRRVLAAYISATQCYKTTLEQLSPLYTHFSMQNAFNGPTNVEIARLVTILALAPAVSQMTNLTTLETLCALPTFKVKLQQASQDLVWIPAVPLLENNTKKICVHLAFDNNGHVIDVSSYSGQDTISY